MSDSNLERLSTLRRLTRMATFIEPKIEEDLNETKLLVMSLYIILLQQQLALAGFPIKGVDNAVIANISEAIKEHINK